MSAGCGSASSHPGTSSQTASATVGTTGGMVATADGALQVVIPAGALPSDVTVTVAPATPPATGSVGTVYEIGPTGTHFSTPITLTLQYDPTKLGGTDPAMLRVATFASGSWQMLPGAHVDTQTKTVSGLTTHLSPYALVSAATGAVCATVSGGTNCSGPSAGTSGGTSAPVCTPVTCADAANSCGAYPGAKLTGCTDGATGFTATCCFDPGAPICFATGAAGGGCTGGSGVPSAGSTTTTTTVTCPPPPTCATATAATACGGYVGSSLQSCADTGSGYTAACCFPAGAPVCVTVAAGGSPCGNVGGLSSCPPPPSCSSGDPCAHTPGTTVQSCTDSSTGYTAVCCYPAGQIPQSYFGSPGGSTSADAGVTSGGGGGGPTAGTDGGQQPPPPTQDGGYVPPPPPPDGGSVPPPTKDGGYVPPPPPPDGGTVPPPTKDGGYVPPPPPPDGGTQPCQIMTMPPADASSPCGVSEFCPSNGDMWSVRCQAPGTPCSCLYDGKLTGTASVSCTPYDPSAMLAACGFPGG